LSALNVAGPLVIDARGLWPIWPWQYHALIGFIIFVIFIGWIIWDKQNEINKVKGRIRLNAAPGTLEINHPLKNEPPLKKDEFSIYTTVYFEIWTNIDIHTASLVLNIVGNRLNLPWWKSWKAFPFLKRLIGIRMEGQDSAIYRKTIKHSDEQPFRDSAKFKWRGKRDIVEWGNAFLLELALELGEPSRILRVYLDPKLYERGGITPL